MPVCSIPGRGEPVRHATVPDRRQPDQLRGASRHRAGLAGRGHPQRGDRTAGVVGLPRSLHGEPGGRYGATGPGYRQRCARPRSARDLTQHADAWLHLSTRGWRTWHLPGPGGSVEGLLDGPSIYTRPGAALSTTGGHGDLHSYPFVVGGGLRPGNDGTFPAGRRHGPNGIARGPGSSCAAARGRDQGLCVLAACCPRWITPSTSSSPTPSCRRSSRWRGWRPGRRSATATASRASWPRLRGRVTTIEHGSYLDEEACDAMRETGTILVPHPDDHREHHLPTCRKSRRMRRPS